MDADLKDAPYRDAALSIDQRVHDLLGRMMLDEKIAQLGGAWPRSFSEGGALDEAKAEQALGGGIGHISHISAATALAPLELARLVNESQRFLIERTRLGIPAVVHGESCAGFTAREATCFPQAIGLASTWAPELIEDMTRAIRAQMRAVGVRQTLAPVMDIVRDARWGRCEETYGEDPHLAGQIGAAYIRGLQGNLRDGIICTGKHFLGYGASEGGMNWAPAHITRRELLEVYAAPFETAIRDGGLASIMNSYAEIDGVPVGSSKELLTDLLRGELGFDGTVVSDYFTVSTLDTYHHIAGRREEAAARALEAGVDVELPVLHYYRALPAALAARRLTMDAVDVAVTRVLRQKFQLGLFEEPFVDAEAAPAAFDTAEHRVLARRIACCSIVLLKNDAGVSGTCLLPLSKEIKVLAVVGPSAASVRLLQGDYHWPAHAEVMFGPIVEAGDGAEVAGAPVMAGAISPGTAPVDLAATFVKHVTVLEGIRQAVAASTQVLHAPGCGITGADTSGFAEAVEAARRADVAVVCVGTRSGLVEGSTSGESSDRADLGLPGVQQQLVEAIVATDTPVVVVLVNGGVLSVPWIAEHVVAVVEAWLPGEEGGNAIADVLFGAVNPSGRLPVSLPRSVGQVPVYYNHKPSGGRTNWRGNYVDLPATPLYPFGHGLSYTRFEYGELSLSATQVTAGGAIEVDVDVTNAGERAGDEIVQLYVHDLVASTTRPVKQLAGFARISLEARQTRRVTFTLDMSKLALYDPEMRLVVEPGGVDVMVGASSEDIRSRATIEIVGERRELRRSDIRSTRVEVR